MSVQTDWPCATSTQELQPSETLSVVARKQSKYWNYVANSVLSSTILELIAQVNGYCMRRS